MNRKILRIAAPAILVVGLLVMWVYADQSPRYQPRGSAGFQKEGIHGAIEWWKQRIYDWKTGMLDADAVRKAEAQLAAMRSMKGLTEDITYYEMGPDNLGGRTRAILIDRFNPNIIYAGAVSGGLWVSTTAGLSWNKITYPYADASTQIVNLKVVSLCQTTNGDIYFGTGEAEGSLGGWSGQGIWKSTYTNNQQGSFVHCPATWQSSVQDAFYNVNKLAADPVNPQVVYAGTAKGLFKTIDGGTTWSRIEGSSTPNGLTLSDSFKECSDVKTAEGGMVIASINDKFYISTDNGASFFRNSGSPMSSGGRLELAIAPSDPNYIYCSAAASNGTLAGILKSTDKGQTWDTIGPAGYVNFQPFSTQGTYDNVIAVYPTDKDRIILGGIDLWSKNSSPTSSDTWEPISMWFADPASSLFVHADQHAIVFHPNYNGTTNKIIYFGNDGGIFQSLDGGETFRNLNRNYNTIQFYAIGFDGQGHVGGGTQDNGTIYIDFLGNTPQNGLRIKGGDGGYTELSSLNPNVTFATTYYGGLKRAEERSKNFDDPENPVGKYFFSNRILNKYFGGLESNISDISTAASFVTPIALYENFNDEESIDSVTFHNDTVSMVKDLWATYISQMESSHTGLEWDTLERINTAGEKVVDTWFTFASGDQVVGHSAIYARPLPITLQQALHPGESVRIQDTYQAMLAIGFNKNVWITRKPLAFNISSAVMPWYPVTDFDGATSSSVLNIGQVGTMAFSKDGNHLFFASDTRLFRVSGLNLARTQAELDADLYADSGTVVIETKLIQTFDRYITGIAVDPNGGPTGKVVVTFGGYGNSQVRYSTNAYSSAPTFSNKMGTLPGIPIFTAGIDINDPKRVLIGTEYGVFSTSDITAGSPVWEDKNLNKMQHVPVMHIRQQWLENDWTHGVYNYGQFYFGTHGRGIFSDKDRPNTAIPQGPEIAVSPGLLKTYPNPAGAFTTLSFTLAQSGPVEISLFNLQGKLVKSLSEPRMFSGKQNLTLDTGDFEKGIYVVRLRSGKTNLTAKLVVQ